MDSTDSDSRGCECRCHRSKKATMRGDLARESLLKAIDRGYDAPTDDMRFAGVPRVLCVVITVALKQ